MNRTRWYTNGGGDGDCGQKHGIVIFDNNKSYGYAIFILILFCMMIFDIHIFLLICTLQSCVLSHL